MDVDGVIAIKCAQVGCPGMGGLNSELIIPGASVDLDIVNFIIFGCCNTNTLKCIER